MINGNQWDTPKGSERVLFGSVSGVRFGSFGLGPSAICHPMAAAFAAMIMAVFLERNNFWRTPELSQGADWKMT